MKRAIFITLGLVFSGIGIVGAILPILPTFPFAMAALYFFSRSSDRFRQWLLNNRFLGPSVKRFQSKQGLSVKAKVSILFFAWISIGCSIIFLIHVLWVKWMLLGVLILKTFVIIRYKTYSSCHPENSELSLHTETGKEL